LVLFFILYIGADVVVVVVVVKQPLAVTHINLSNSLDICHRRLLCVLQPICLDGIAIILYLLNYI